MSIAVSASYSSLSPFRSGCAGFIRHLALGLSIARGKHCAGPFAIYQPCPCILWGANYVISTNHAPPHGSSLAYWGQLSAGLFFMRERGAGTRRSRYVIRVEETRAPALGPVSITHGAVSTSGTWAECSTRGPVYTDIPQMISMVLDVI